MSSIFVGFFKSSRYFVSLCTLLYSGELNKHRIMIQVMTFKGRIKICWML